MNKNKADNLMTKSALLTKSEIRYLITKSAIEFKIITNF